MTTEYGFQKQDSDEQNYSKNTSEPPISLARELSRNVTQHSSCAIVSLKSEEEGPWAEHSGEPVYACRHSMTSTAGATCPARSLVKYSFGNSSLCALRGVAFSVLYVIKAKLMGKSTRMERRSSVVWKIVNILTLIDRQLAAQGWGHSSRETQCRPKLIFVISPFNTLKGC